ncbi:MAG TPA: YciI family protein [Streptosporangiaceae bacterium]|jgi:hypothetical protein
MAEYLVLIYEDEKAYADATPATFGGISAAHTAFAEANGAAMRGGKALQPTGTATSIRTNDAGEYLVTDGPYAETREALGGYYLIEAPDLDQAIEVAKQVPARFGGVEVRPVMVFE